MTYKIVKTDGTLLTEIVDGAVDKASSSLSLPGKNFVSYGTVINENFVKLLENFAARNSPDNPLIGQVWYDSENKRIKVFNGAVFTAASGPIVSPSVPLSFTAGDIWINSEDNQVFFNDGNDTISFGPIYTKNDGICGFTVDTVLDTRRKNKVILKMWVGSALLGIFSTSTTPFEMLTAIPNFSGTIVPGFNASLVENMRLDVTTLSADNIVTSTGVYKPVKSLMLSDANTGTTGTVSIKNATPLLLGGTNAEVAVNNVATTITSPPGKDFVIKTKSQTGSKDAIRVKNTGDKVLVFSGTGSSFLDIPGTFKASGKVTFSGSHLRNNSSANEIAISGSYIEINAGETGDGSSVDYNRFIVNRGTFTDADIRWNEIDDAWEFSHSGSYTKLLDTTGLSQAAYTGELNDIIGSPHGAWSQDLNNLSINYTASNVGIKNTAPTAALDVSGVAFSKTSFLGHSSLVSSASINIDPKTAYYFDVSITGNTIFTVSSIAANTHASFVLELTTNGLFDISWWPVKWERGSSPDTSIAGTHIFKFHSVDSGATWVGVLVGMSFA